MDREKLGWVIDYGAAGILAAAIGLSAELARRAGAIEVGNAAILVAMALAMSAAFLVLRRYDRRPAARKLPSFELATFPFDQNELILMDALPPSEPSSRAVRLFGADSPGQEVGWATDSGQDNDEERIYAALADIRYALRGAESRRDR